MTETFYMPEMYDLLKREVEDADLVVGFDHQVCRDQGFRAAFNHD